MNLKQRLDRLESDLPPEPPAERTEIDRQALTSAWWAMMRECRDYFDDRMSYYTNLDRRNGWRKQLAEIDDRGNPWGLLGNKAQALSYLKYGSLWEAYKVLMAAEDSQDPEQFASALAELDSAWAMPDGAEWLKDDERIKERRSWWFSFCFHPADCDTKRPVGSPAYQHWRDLMDQYFAD